MDKATIIQKIKDSGVAEDLQADLIAQVEAADDASAEAVFQDALQRHIDAGFAEAGVQVPMDDPEIAQAAEEMQAELQEAGDEAGMQIEQALEPMQDVANNLANAAEGLEQDIAREGAMNQE